jgi:hypothetical protein
VTGKSEFNRSLRKVQQRASHAHLAQDFSRVPAFPAPSKHGRVDAIIVPAARHASFLQQTIELSALLEIPLVALCSKQARVEEVAQLASRAPGAHALVVEIPPTLSHPDFPARTSRPVFRTASANRESDLSAKRNVGLLLARLHGWSKVVFVDDDITSLQAGSVVRLGRQLDNHQVAGMVVSRHPDNSVVCHARRLAGFWQDVFVTGAVMGVRCNDLPLSFFPDIYNEDWFFFSREAAARHLPSVGYARQAVYDPFANPDRARWEEFGDLIAEGLYALFDLQSPKLPFAERLAGATSTYWWSFIDARLKVINKVNRALYRLLDQDPNNVRVYSALSSLAAAKHQLRDAIKPDLCTNFLDAWRADFTDWQKFSSSVNNVGSTREAMDFLQLKTWLGPNLVPQRSNAKKRRTSLRIC